MEKVRHFGHKGLHQLQKSFSLSFSFITVKVTKLKNKEKDFHGQNVLPWPSMDLLHVDRRIINVPTGNVCHMLFGVALAIIELDSFIYSDCM